MGVLILALVPVLLGVGVVAAFGLKAAARERAPKATKAAEAHTLAAMGASYRR